MTIGVDTQTILSIRDLKVSYYTDAGILREVAGDAPIDEVGQALVAAARI